jgi:hypothetical protein
MAEPIADASAKLAHTQLAEQERLLVAAMTDYAAQLTEPPRDLIIDVERQRVHVKQLFEVAMEALDALSLRTGFTDFGSLNN